MLSALSHTMPTIVSDYPVNVLPSARQFITKFDETILEAAIRQGITLPYGCKDGACGSCKCRLLQGDVEMLSHAAHAISDAEKSQGYILTCRTRPKSEVVLESRQVTDKGAFPIRKMPVRVLELTRLSQDVMRIRIQLPALEIFRSHAGQYIEFILADGVRRAYSMAAAPLQTQESQMATEVDRTFTLSAEVPHYPSPHSGLPHTATQATPNILELHIRHLPGGKFTDQVFHKIRPRDILRIEGPFGSFYLREESDRPIILLASGTGFAPVKAILEQMQQKSIHRPVSLYWGGRRPADLYMNEWIEQLTQDMPNLRYTPVISDAAPDNKWSGRTGLVHQAILDDHPDLSQHEVYACGAPAMVEAARQAYISTRNLPADQFYADAFTSEADKHA